MAKLIAVLNVIAWSGFWAFGYLALSSGSEAGHQTVIAILLAAVGGAAGEWMLAGKTAHIDDPSVAA